jgi:methionyl aminopeptidase
MTAQSPADIAGLRAIGRIVRAVFETMKRAARSGVTTAELDAIAATELERRGARSAPQHFYKFPGATCISVNEEAAHGIPGTRRLVDGDMVNIDVSAERDGYVADMGESFVVGTASTAQAKLLDATRRAVAEAIDSMRAGRALNVIGRAVEKVAREGGYRIVRNLGSHGVGRSLHEEPSYVPVYNPLDRRKLTDGLVLTIEPFFTTGSPVVEEANDGWTLMCSPGAMVAQFEHTVIVTKSRAIVVT